MSKLLPHVLSVTVPLIAGVKAYHTPLPKLDWHVGTGSPVFVALIVLSVLATPAESGIAPIHLSFTGVGIGVGVGDGLGVGVGDGEGVGVGVGLGEGVGEGVGDGIGLGDGVGVSVGVGVGVLVGVGVGVSTGVGVGLGVSVGVGSCAYVIAVTNADTRQVRINLRIGLSIPVPIACLALGGVHCYIFSFAVKPQIGGEQIIRAIVTAR